MMIWSLDLSLSNSGVSIFMQDGTPIKIDSIATNAKEETSVRLHKIAEYFTGLKNEFPPNLVILEKGFYRYNTSTQQIYRVAGVVECILWDVEKVYIEGTTVKKTVTGKGNSKKLMLKKTIQKKYPNIKFKNFDESDSFAVGLTYFYEKGILKNG